MSFKVGIIGAGGMAAYHIEGYRRAGAEIAAVADLNTDAGTALADSMDIPKVYGDVAEMLEKEGDIQAVSVITPNKFHKELSVQALQAGKHVFCEKPPALNAGEVEEMIDASKRAGKTLMFNFNNRARPESLAISGYIGDGAVGRINSAQAKWIRRTGIPGFGGWFTNKDFAGGGALIDLLHMLDLSMYFMGYPNPEFVLAQTFDDFISDKTFKGPWGIPDKEGGVTNVETACHGFIKFKTGQVISVQISWAEMNKREEVSVVFQGQKAGGMVRRLFGIDGLDETAEDCCELYVQENGFSVNRDIIFEPDESMGRIGSAENFILSIQGKAEPLNNADEALKLMKIIDAMYASSQSGRPVEIH
jgi:predicted dehydrogenase